MRFVLIALVTVVAVHCGFPAICNASSAIEEVPDDYPGLLITADGDRILAENIALRVIQQGVYAYHFAFGEWPASWSKVREEGLCQVDLYSPQGNVIDPDDESIDFMWDVTYSPSSDYYTNPRTITIMEIDGSPHNSMDPFENKTSLQEMVSNLDGDDAVKLQLLAENPDWRKLAAIRLYCNKMLLQYNYRFGWNTWDDFLNSIYSPINHNSINPLTGEVFGFGDKPNDLKVTIANKEGMISIQMTNEVGEVEFAFYP